MIHEAMVLEYSAASCGDQWASALKLFASPASGSRCSCPWALLKTLSWLAIATATPILVAKLAVGGFALALIETRQRNCASFAPGSSEPRSCNAGRSSARLIE